MRYKDVMKEYDIGLNEKKNLTFEQGADGTIRTKTASSHPCTAWCHGYQCWPRMAVYRRVKVNDRYMIRNKYFFTLDGFRESEPETKL